MHQPEHSPSYEPQNTYRHPYNTATEHTAEPTLKTIIWAVGNIKKIYVDDEKIDTIWDISADEVGKRGEICYMNPCIAQTLYTIKKLKEVYPAETIALGVEFLTYADNRQSCHFFIEIQHPNDTYIIDFAHDNKVFFYQWPYQNRNQKHTITSDEITTVPALLIQHNDTIFDIAKKVWMDIKALEQQLSAHIQQLKKANTPAEWKDFTTHRNWPLEIIDGNIDFFDIACYINDALYTELLWKDNALLLHHFDTYKLEIHALLLQPPTVENQQQLVRYLTA